MIDHGTGSPLVLIPGIQGRWEWMGPTVRALAARHRVLSFSLTEATGDSAFDAWTTYLDRALDARALTRSAVVGVSFGGIVAVSYAARRPARVSALVLVSTPSPRWRLDAQSAGYAQRPRMSMPFFAVRAVRRLTPEVRAAFPTWRRRLGFAARHASRVVRWPPSAPRMAEWAQEWMATDIVAECGRVSAPTLLVTGEPRLDRVVPVSSTLEYLTLIPGSRHVTLEQTGHLGLVSKPEAFADVVSRFARAHETGATGIEAGREPTSRAMEA